MYADADVDSEEEERTKDIAEREMDPYVYHFTTDNLPPLNVQRHDVHYMPNGWKNAYVQNTRLDVNERKMDPNVYDFVHADPVVPHNHYTYTRPDHPNAYNGGTEWSWNAQQNGEDTSDDEDTDEEDQ